MDHVTVKANRNPLL